MQEKLKKQAAEAALPWVKDDMIVGVGTGSTVKYFIEALASIKHRIEAAIPSSEATAQQLKNLGIPQITLNAVSRVPLYVDGADEVIRQGLMIKGGGGAATREKIIASAADKFICIADESKLVKRLGNYPVAVEVCPIARSFVARALVVMGGSPVYREDFITDNGNIILDVHYLSLDKPLALEESITLIPGVVECGLFARRCADDILIATASGIQHIVPNA